MNIIEYLDSKNIEYKIQGQEILIYCPQCGKQKLSINSNSELFQCFVCAAEQPNSKYAKGHLSTLQKDFGDIIEISKIQLPKRNPNKEDRNFSNLVTLYHNNLLESKEGLKYLYKRGFNNDDIEYFRFGYVEMQDEKWIAIPSFYKKIPKLIKYRKITNNVDIDKYIREFGSNSVLFNQTALDEFDEVFVLEGEIDAATLIKHGYVNTVGLTGGAGTLLTEHYDELILKKKIYLVLDPDKAGQEAAKNVFAKRLGINKCWNILLPEDEDVNSFFLKYTKEDFDKLVSRAFQFKVEGITSLEDVLYGMINRESYQAYSLPWEFLNRFVNRGGLCKSHLTVIGARAGVGKTSMAVQIAYHFAKVHKVPSFIFCMEMKEIDLAIKIVQVGMDLSYDEIDYNQGPTYAMELGDLPIYFGYSGKITPEIYYNTAKEVRNRYGCELFIFDNLQLLVVSDSEADFSAATKMFKRVAMDLDVMMLLVSQPTKIGNERELTFNDLKGSSALGQDPDEIILLNRQRIKGNDGFEALESKTKVLVDKTRFSLGGGCLLEFLGSKSKFIQWENK
uniref:Putative helicase n=1 Tax=viral metagenome TaxID=1070528 RepID=A0A6H1ZQN1_9ZZZZ